MRCCVTITQSLTATSSPTSGLSSARLSKTRIARSPQGGSVLGAEEPVARVAETGDDVRALVEVAVERGHVDRHARMSALEDRDAFGRRDQRQEADRTRGDATFDQQPNRVRGRVTGREHRIADDEEPALDLRQPDVVLDRALVRPAVQSDVPHSRRRDQLEQPVGHAEARAQDRDDRDLLAGDDRRVHLRERRLDRASGEREVARDLVAHQQRDLAQQLAKGARRRCAIAHVRELVLDERMIDDVQVREARVGKHVANAAALQPRSLKRWILPVAVFGNSSTNSTQRGYLNGASWSFTYDRSSSASAGAAFPGSFSTT